MSILKFKILILISSLVNSIGLLLSSTKYILNENRSFNDNVLNGKQCSVLFTFLRLLKLIFTQNDFSLIYSQFSILSKLINPSIFDILPFISATFASFNHLQVTNICFVSFCTDYENNKSIGVRL